MTEDYHVCEYLEGAAPAGSGKSGKAARLNRQKEFLKDGCAEKVTEALPPHLEPETTEDRNTLSAAACVI